MHQNNWKDLWENRLKDIEEYRHKKKKLLEKHYNKETWEWDFEFLEKPSRTSVVFKYRPNLEKFHLEILNMKNPPLCANPECNNYIKFISLYKGYTANYCSQSCNSSCNTKYKWTSKDYRNKINSHPNNILAKGRNIRKLNKRLYKNKDERIYLYISELTNNLCKIGSGNIERVKHSGKPLIVYSGKASEILALENEILETSEFLFVNSKESLQGRHGSSEIRDELVIGLAQAIISNARRTEFKSIKREDINVCMM